MKRILFLAAMLATTAAHAGECELGWECSDAIVTTNPPSRRPTDAEFKAARHMDTLRECDKLPTTIGVLLCRADAE
jgi:hypothetical protein